MYLNNYFIKNNGHTKYVAGKNYNYVFNMKNGSFARWGKTMEDDPQYSPIGPELLDIEVSTICHRSCDWCYKSNKPSGKNMNFETFKKILGIIPPNLTQIAFGVGDIDANRDLWKMFEYCKNANIVPNITINGERLNDEIANKLAKYCGAVAISHYDSDICFNAIKKLTDRASTQVNIQKLVARETLDSCYKLLNAVNKDPRLTKLNAIVFLTFKKKGMRNTYHSLSKNQFTALVNYVLMNDVRIGFDSCTANKVLEIIKDRSNYKILEMMAEPCESSLFSLYINVDGMAHPCSFLEGEEGYKGINMLNVKDFFKDLWISPFFMGFRKNLLSENRNCPRFEL